LPPVPQPVIAAPPSVAVVVPVLGAIELPAPLKPVALTPVALPDPLSLPQALGLFAPIKPSHAPRHRRSAPTPRAHVLGAAVTLRAPLTTVTTTTPVRDARTASHRTASHRAPPPWETLSLILDSSFAPAPAGASAGGGGAAGSGAAAALSLWLLLQLPGFAYLRLPARQRRPRGPVDDTLTRPG